MRSKHTGDVVQPRRCASQRAGLGGMSTYQVWLQHAQGAPKLDQRRYIAVWPHRPDQASYRQPGDPCLAELVGENAGCSGDHRDLMAKLAQLERKLAHVALGSAKNVATGEHMNDLHARPRRSFSRVSSDAGRKVSLDGRPYQAASRFHRVRHSSQLGCGRRSRGLVTNAVLKAGKDCDAVSGKPSRRYTH